MKLDKRVGFTWVRKWAKAFTKSQNENEDSWWWKKEVTLWTWDARWRLSSYCVGEEVFILRIHGVPGIHESHREGLESRQKPRKSSIWNSWNQSKTAPPMRRISSPNMLLILWPGCKFWGPSTDRVNSGHKPAPSVPQASTKRKDFPPTSSILEVAQEEGIRGRHQEPQYTWSSSLRMQIRCQQR